MKYPSREACFIFQKGGLHLRNRVKELRLRAGMTQQELAEGVRVSPRTIISLEKEQYNPSLLLAYRIACLFGTTVEELYCLRENLQQEETRYADLQ